MLNFKLKGNLHKFPLLKLEGGAKLHKNFAQKLLAISLCAALVLCTMPLRGGSYVSEATTGSDDNLGEYRFYKAGTSAPTWLGDGYTQSVQPESNSAVFRLGWASWKGNAFSRLEWQEDDPLIGAALFSNDGGESAGSVSVEDGVVTVSGVQSGDYLNLSLVVDEQTILMTKVTFTVGGFSLPSTAAYGTWWSLSKGEVWDNRVVSGSPVTLSSAGEATLWLSSDAVALMAITVTVLDSGAATATYDNGALSISGASGGETVYVRVDAGSAGLTYYYFPLTAAGATPAPDPQPPTDGGTTDNPPATGDDKDDADKGDDKDDGDKGDDKDDTPTATLEAVVPTKFGNQRIRVVDSYGVLPEGARLFAASVQTHEGIDDTHEIEHVFSYSLSLLDATGEPLKGQLDAPVELYFEVLKGMDAKELEVVLVNSGVDREFIETIVDDVDGPSWVKVTTDHFSPYALIDTLSAEEKAALNAQTGDVTTQTAVAGLGIVLVLALGIMLRLLTGKRELN